jgi:uncharacterized tellurite resistance protein B-like protein
MYLTRLNEAQRKSFMALVTKMALADGKVSPEETTVLEDIADALGQTEPVPAEEIYGATNIAPFDTHQSRMVTLLGMLVVAYSDRKFHIDESTVLSETIKAFDIPETKLNDLKEWARKQADLLNDFHGLID